MTPEQLRALAAQLLSKVDTMGRKIHRDETIIEQLSHGIAILKRHKFAKRSEQISPAQGSLLDDLLTTDLEAIDAELQALRPAPVADEPRQQPKRALLPAQLPRTVIRHEPIAPSAPAAASFSASAKTSARSWTTLRACLPSSNMCVASGPAASARH